MDCPFCALSPDRIAAANDHAITFRDGFPVASGHALVIPRVHVASLFDLVPGAQAAVWQLMAEVRIQLAQELHPDGFNIGVNDGRAAGQTVMHAHIHVIPRWIGDVPDPRGGIRWVIPTKAAYWRER